MSICILTCITIIYVYFCRNTNHLFRKSVKRYSARFTLFLSVRERAMDIIGYNYLKTIRKLHSKNCLFVQHLLARNLLASSADENSIRFRLLFPLNCITLRSSIFSIFLLRREVICRTTFYLLPLSTDQSASERLPAPFCRLQATCDFFGRIPAIDTSLRKRDSGIRSPYY